LAQRDSQIAELQQAVIELANQGDTSGLEGADPRTRPPSR
jgi:hypothetical protein